MKRCIIDVLQCNMLHTIWHRLSHHFTDEVCYARFVSEMNEWSLEWGLNNSKWINPSGLGEYNTYSKTTANDLSVMALRTFAMGGGKIQHHINRYELNIIKPYLVPKYRVKKKQIETTTPMSTIGYDFPILSAKTGSGDGYQTLAMVCKIGEYVVSGAIMNAKDEQGRFIAMEELMKIGYNILYKDATATQQKCINAKNACLYIGDSKSGAISCIFAQNSDELSPPMSTTKMLTVAIAQKYLIDESKVVIITPYDAKCDNGHDVLHRWDSLTIRDLKYAAMLPSSNVAANALARLAGEEMLKQSI